MNWDEADDKTIYKVVRNAEGHYSIWNSRYGTPAGWEEVGKSGIKDDCLAYIEEVWTDMRPADPIRD